MSDNTETKLAVHEAVCASRYASIQESLDRGRDRMRNIEWLLYIVIAAVLFGPGVAADFVKKLLGL
jgi:hypothetical protein